MNSNINLKLRIAEQFGSQTIFASKIRTHQSFVSDVVRGRVNLTIIEQRNWAKFLDCHIDEIFSPNISICSNRSEQVS